MLMMSFFFSSRRRHTICSLVTGVQTCALPISVVKADADLRRIPFVVLTTSQAVEDILRTYDLHANAYVSKPVDFDAFLEVIRQIDNFYISVVTLPRD